MVDVYLSSPKDVRNTEMKALREARGPVGMVKFAPNTRRNYRERYVQNIQPVIGSMLMSEVKPMHCKVVLNRMEVAYAGATIKQTYIAMGPCFVPL